jgi:hypothetical protein
MTRTLGTNTLFLRRKRFIGAVEVGAAQAIPGRKGNGATTTLILMSRKAEGISKRKNLRGRGGG